MIVNAPLFCALHKDYAMAYLNTGGTLYKLTPKHTLVLVRKSRKNFKMIYKDLNLDMNIKKKYFEEGREGMSTVDRPLAVSVCKVLSKSGLHGWIWHEDEPTLGEVMVCNVKFFNIEEIKVKPKKRKREIIDLT